MHFFLVELASVMASTFISETLKSSVNQLDSLSEQIYFEISEVSLSSEDKVNLNLVNSLILKLKDKKTSIKINEISKILKPINNEKLNNLIILYSILLIYKNLLTNYLNLNNPLNDNYLYYDLVLNSKFNLLIYSIQTLPIRVYNLSGLVFNEIKSKNIEIKSITKYPILNKFLNYFNEIYKSIYNNLILNNKRIHKFRMNNIGINSSILKVPFNSIIDELKYKKSKIETEKLNLAKKLGYLINNIPNFNDLVTSEDIDLFLKKFIKEIGNEGLINESSFDSINNLIDHLSKEDIDIVKKPGFFTRYWPNIFIFLIYGPITIKSIISNKYLILKFIKENLIDTCFNFYKNWILKPLNDIFNTIKHDSNSEISIMSQNSLNSELDSLKRMVIDYTIETQSHLSPEETLAMKVKLDELITNGDLTPFMEGYEKDIKNPLRSIINGKLTRGLLIQLQKTKVDGSIAINGIDKLLKSQQLVFGVIAASPSVVIVFYLINFFNSYINNEYYIKDKIKLKKVTISKNLNNIERLINDDKDEDIKSGFLLLEIFSLRKNGIGLIPISRRDEWIRDINDLLKDNKLTTLTRIYNVYSKYF